MASYTGGIPVIGGAQWNGNQQLATKNQLLSSINGLYLDFQDIELSTIKVANLTVSTLTAAQYVSTPELYVSTIIGGGIQVNNGILQISTGDFSLVSLSTLSLSGIDLGGIDLSFDLGLGNALGGFLGGLGALVGGAFIGIGTGVGLSVQGLETGLATLINGRAENFINNNVFETINATTQLQISTLGGPDAFYSSIFRTVSSASANSVPGRQVFVSTIFPRGTTCIRSVSDPLNLIVADSNLATSTIQSFGQWVPFLDPTVAGEDTFARNAQFSTLTVSLSNGFASITGGGIITVRNTRNTLRPPAIVTLTEQVPLVSTFNIPFSQPAIAAVQSNITFIDNNSYPMNLSFISTAYTPYTSSIGNYTGGVFFLTSTITNQSTIPQFTWVGSGIGNFAVCEPDETGFLSTGQMDLIAQSADLVFQWGLAVDNFNSTIGVGTAKRVSWDIPNNTSNFMNIPLAQSTLRGNRSLALAHRMYVNQLEMIVQDQTSFGGFPYLPIAFNIAGACFGSNTAWSNYSGYPYQFNKNVFVNGTLEAETLIAISSIINVSTNLQTFFSTQTFDADEATISSLTVTSLLTSPNGSISSFNSSNANIFNLNTSNATFSTLEVSTLTSYDYIYGNFISTFGLDTFASGSEISYISTLLVNFQILESAPGNLPIITRLNTIVGDPGSKITYTQGIFQNLFCSTNTVSSINFSTPQQLGLTTLLNYPGALTAINNATNTTAPVVGIGFKAQQFLNCNAQTRIDYNFNQITGTSDGGNFYPFTVFDPTQTAPNLWSVTNVNTATISSLNVTNISTSSHSGDNITANTVTILSNLTFPSVNCNATPIVLTLSNTNLSNEYVAFEANVIEGPAFPQASNQFTITTSSSNTQIQDKEGLVFSLLTGTAVTFGGNIDTVTLNSADFLTRSVRYGTSLGGFLQPRAFSQSNQSPLGTGTNTTVYVQVTDGSNTFDVADYNFMPCMMGFNVLNTAVGVNEAIVRPFQSNAQWWVRLDIYINVGAAGADVIWYWNNLLFPYNMMT